MITIRIACLPWSKGDPVLNVLYEEIAAVVRSVPSAKVEQENDLLVLYEEDLMPDGLGNEVLVEILDIPETMGLEDRNTLSKGVGRNVFDKVRTVVPSTRVKCVVRNPDPKDITTIF